MNRDPQQRRGFHSRLWTAHPLIILAAAVVHIALFSLIEIQLPQFEPQSPSQPSLVLPAEDPEMISDSGFEALAFRDAAPLFLPTAFNYPAPPPPMQVVGSDSGNPEGESLLLGEATVDPLRSVRESPPLALPSEINLLPTERNFRPDLRPQSEGATLSAPQGRLLLTPLSQSTEPVGIPLPTWVIAIAGENIGAHYQNQSLFDWDPNDPMRIDRLPPIIAERADQDRFRAWLAREALLRDLAPGLWQIELQL